MSRWAALALLALAAPGCERGAASPPTTEASWAPAPRGTVASRAERASCCLPSPSGAPAEAGDEESPALTSLPDVTLLDQDGREVRFVRDVLRDRVVAINFVFTACKAACPSIGLNFAQLQDLLGERLGRDCVLVTISVDPENDRPEDLKAWPARCQFEAGPGWRLLTGKKADVDRLLKALKSYAPERQSHSQMIVLGDPARGNWSRVGALTDPAKLAEMLRDHLDARSSRVEAGIGPTSAGDSAARAYFTDTPLRNQSGETMRFYSDLLAGKVVVIDVFFTGCKESCLKLGATMKFLQDQLGDRVGKDVHLISLSVDPANDSVEQLAASARAFGAKRGWFLLTGDQEDVETVLRKLGQHVDRREDHQTILIIGNVPTGLWKKAMGLAPPSEILMLVEGVLDDPGGE